MHEMDFMALHLRPHDALLPRLELWVHSANAQGERMDANEDVRVESEEVVVCLAVGFGCPAEDAPSFFGHSSGVFVHV